MFKREKDPEPTIDYRSLLIDLCKENGYEMYEKFAGDKLLMVRVKTGNNRYGYWITEYVYAAGRSKYEPELDVYKSIHRQLSYDLSVREVKVV